MPDHTRWYEINAKLGITASLIDHRLLEDSAPPLPMVGGFFHSVARLSERYEALIVRVGRDAGDRLSDEALDGLRTVLRHLQAARTALDETVVPALDPDHFGITGPGR